MKLIWEICVAAVVVLGGCAMSPERARLEAAAVEGGTATAFIIMPCTPNNWVIPDGWMPEYDMIVDDQKVGTIAQCQHRTIKLASGMHSIQVRARMAFFTPAAVKYPVPPNSELYLRATYESGNARMQEVDAEGGRANIGRIDRRELL